MLEYFPVVLPELKQVYTQRQSTVSVLLARVWFHSLILCPGSIPPYVLFPYITSNPGCLAVIMLDLFSVHIFM